ncbi:hypothetical protein TNCV_4514211 [Trichonephila clavipes]|nr:hypothetical protein TNCV_4514211 [Trichonephila clavipes]
MMDFFVLKITPQGPNLITTDTKLVDGGGSSPSVSEERTPGSRATRLCSQGTYRQRFVLFLLLLLLLLKQDYEGPYHIASMKVNIAFLARKPSGHGRELVTKVIGSWVRNLGPLKTRRVEDLMHIQEEGASSCVVLVT